MWSSQYTCTVIPISAVKKLQHEGQDVAAHRGKKAKKASIKAGRYQYGLYYIQTEKKTSSRQYIQEENWKKVAENLHSFHSFIRKALRCMVTLTYVTKVWCCHKNRKKGQNWVVRRASKEESTKKIIFFAVSVPKNHFQFQNTDVLVVGLIK